MAPDETAPADALEASIVLLDETPPANAWVNALLEAWAAADEVDETPPADALLTVCLWESTFTSTVQPPTSKSAVECLSRGLSAEAKVTPRQENNSAVPNTILCMKMPPITPMVRRMTQVFFSLGKTNIYIMPTSLGLVTILTHWSKMLRCRPEIIR